MMADHFVTGRAEIENIDSRIQFADYGIVTAREDYAFFVGDPDNGRPMTERTQSRRYVDICSGLDVLLDIIKKSTKIIVGTTTYFKNAERTETETFMTIQIFDGYL